VPRPPKLFIILRFIRAHFVNTLLGKHGAFPWDVRDRGALNRAGGQKGGGGGEWSFPSSPKICAKSLDLDGKCGASLNTLHNIRPFRAELP